MVDSIGARLPGPVPAPPPQSASSQSASDEATGTTESQTGTETTSAADHAQQVLQTMKDVNAAAKTTRKSLVKQRLEMIKQQLKVAKMMGGNPLKVAEQATDIAQKTALASRDYADAVRSGSSDPITLSAAASSAVANAAAAQTPEAAKAAAEAKAVAEAKAALAKNAEEAANGSDKTTESKEEKEAAAANQTLPPGWISDDHFDATPDGKFFVEARGIMAQARKLVDAAHQQIRKTAGSAADSAFNDVRKALRESEKMIVTSRNQVKSDADADLAALPPPPLLRISA